MVHNGDPTISKCNSHICEATHLERREERSVASNHHDEEANSILIDYMYNGYSESFG